MLQEASCDLLIFNFVRQLEHPNYMLHATKSYSTLIFFIRTIL